MSSDPGSTHYVGDGCQPAHDPAIDQPPPEVTFDELHTEYLREIASKLRAEKEVARLQRENGSLARMYALTEDLLRERTGRLNEAEAEVARLRLRVGLLEEAMVDMGYGDHPLLASDKA